MMEVYRGRCSPAINEHFQLDAITGTALSCYYLEKKKPSTERRAFLDPQVKIGGVGRHRCGPRNWMDSLRVFGETNGNEWLSGLLSGVLSES